MNNAEYYHSQFGSLHRQAAAEGISLARPKPDIETMRMLLKLACLGDAKAAADLDSRLNKLS